MTTNNGAVLLNGAPIITTAIAPTFQSFNSYNAASGALAITLPALGGCGVGANSEVEKAVADTTMNAVTLTCAGADTFDDLSTSLVLSTPGEKRFLQVVSIAGTKYWKAGVGYSPKGGLASITGPYSLANSTAATTIIANTLMATGRPAGATYQIILNGTIQTAAASGLLTFTPFIQGTALAQTAVLASTASANVASAFMLKFLVTVQTTGTSGTAIASPWGQANLATTGVSYLTSTSTAATTINTTSAASSNVLSVTAQWATASASNILKVQTAVIERVV